MTADLIETVARYLCALDTPATHIDTNWRFFVPAAHGSIRAIEQAGFKIVAREPTERMLEALFTMTDIRSPWIWRAAFDAAPTWGGEK